jgi:integrase
MSESGTRDEREEREPIRLNKTEVAALQAASRDYFNPVEGYRGLCVRVLPNGQKSYVLRYRFSGIQKKHVLGQSPEMTPDAAKKAHAAAWNLINAGTDPGQAKAQARQAAKEEKRKALTVADLADRYLREHVAALGDHWRKEATRLINKHIIPALGPLPLAKVGPADISALLYEMRQKTSTMANRTRAVLRTMFSRAEEWEYRPLGSNPVAVVKQRGQETKRDRRLSDMELKALGAALKDSGEGATVLLGLRLALLAGMRKGEVQGARWEWVDLDAGEIRIPKEFHKTGKKTGKPRIVHLCSALVADLKVTIPTIGCPYVVPGKARRRTDGKGVEWKPTADLQAPWKRIREAAGLAVAGEMEDADPGLHDLRRTFASVGTDLGLKGFAGELLGHSEQTVTDIYTRSAAEPLHDAAERIGARIDGILSGKIDPEKEAEERRQAKEARAPGTA